MTTTKLTKISGRVIFEEDEPATRSKPMLVTSVPPTLPREMAFAPSASARAEVRADLTFELAGLFGPQILRVSRQPREWIVRTVKYRGDDVTYTPVEFKSSAEPATVEIILTKRGAVVSGRVVDAEGRGTEAAYVVLISADPVRRRVGTGVVSSVHPKADGTFTLDPVPVGEHVIVAASGEQMSHVLIPVADEETLERLVDSGERLVLVESEARSVDIRVVKQVSALTWPSAPAAPSVGRA